MDRDFANIDENFSDSSDERERVMTDIASDSMPEYMSKNPTYATEESTMPLRAMIPHKNKSHDFRPNDVELSFKDLTVDSPEKKSGLKRPSYLPPIEKKYYTPTDLAKFEELGKAAVANISKQATASDHYQDKGENTVNQIDVKMRN